MFIFLSKILPPLLYPLGLACILLLIALLLKNKSKFQRFLLIITLLVLYLAGNRWVAFGLVRSLEWRYLPTAEIPTADVIVVLGGGTNSALYPRQIVEVNGAGDRVIYALWLYKQGRAENVLLSGTNINWLSTNANPAEDMADLLMLMGVPQEALWLENQSRNTYENALECQKLLQNHAIDRVILVTSAIHMPRSVALFEEQGIQIIPAPTDYTVTQDGWEQLFNPSPTTLLTNLIPSAENLNLTTNALKEYIGMLVYALRGWM
jgi:uncharacterized SAM-binding protein YcdF (DUF218 family)